MLPLARARARRSGGAAGPDTRPSVGAPGLCQAAPPTWPTMPAAAALLASVGPHTRGKGCPYLKDLDAVDFTVLEEVVRRSSSAVTAGVVDERLVLTVTPAASASSSGSSRTTHATSGSDQRVSRVERRQAAAGSAAIATLQQYPSACRNCPQVGSAPVPCGPRGEDSPSRPRTRARRRASARRGAAAARTGTRSPRRRTSGGPSAAQPAIVVRRSAGSASPTSCQAMATPSRTRHESSAARSRSCATTVACAPADIAASRRGARATVPHIRRYSSGSRQQRVHQCRCARARHVRESRDQIEVRPRAGQRAVGVEVGRHRRGVESLQRGGVRLCGWSPRHPTPRRHRAGKVSTCTDAASPAPRRGPGSSGAAASGLDQRAQHVLQDAAVAVVVRLAGGVDAQHGVELDDACRRSWSP